MVLLSHEDEAGCEKVRREDGMIIHMRRTNLVLDEELLEEALRVLGSRTYSAAVNTALAEVVRIRRIQQLPGFFGEELWSGDLAEMRGDRP
jgi:Arc/MetJ family transcription regulator